MSETPFQKGKVKTQEHIAQIQMPINTSELFHQLYTNAGRVKKTNKQ